MATRSPAFRNAHDDHDRLERAAARGDAAARDRLAALEADRAQGAIDDAIDGVLRSAPRITVLRLAAATWAPVAAEAIQHSDADGLSIKAAAAAWDAGWDAHHGLPDRIIGRARIAAEAAWDPLTALAALRGDKAAVRRALGISRLPKGADEASQRARERADHRRLARAERTVQAERAGGPQERLLEALREAVLESFGKCGFREPSGRWCDRAESALVVSSTPDLFLTSVRSESRKVWDSGGKMRSGTSVSHSFRVQKGWITMVQRRGLDVVDGGLVLGIAPDDGSASVPREIERAREAGCEVLRAVRARQGRGLTLEREEGWIVVGNEEWGPTSWTKRR